MAVRLAKLVRAVCQSGSWLRQKPPGFTLDKTIDDESEKIAQLSQGDALVPMVQSAGGNDWFMVKTAKGVIGWVKSIDVKEEKLKK